MSILLVNGENEYGAESFLRDSIDDYLQVNSFETLHVFDGEDSNVSEVMSALVSQSLFTSGREMVVIKRLGTNKLLKESLLGIINEIPETTELILFDLYIDKRSKLYKEFKKSKRIKTFSPPTESELIKWIKEKIKKEGGSINHKAVRMIIDRTKGNQVAISNELDKLLNFSREIDEDSVKYLVDLAPDDNIFELLDKLAGSRRDLALSKYKELRRAQIEPHYILVMISWQLGNMLLIKLSESKTDREIVSQTKMNPYIVSKTRKLVSKMSRGHIQKMLRLTVEADKKLKTESIDPDQLILNLIAKL